MFRSIVLLLGGLALFCANSLFAQDAVLGQKYGLGVHAYFAGDYLKAYEQLEAATAGGSKDPRVFYFRGLTYLKLGRGQEAVQDFRKGAELESRDTNKFYNVAKALERVQGGARIELEKYRVDARMAALEEAERMRKARYEAIQRDEARVLREQALAPPSSEPAKGAEAAAQPAAEMDLFAAPEDKAAPSPEKKPTKAAPPGKKAAAAESKKKPAEAPATDDPFATPPAEKATTR
jgi:tetratricopeptide (TPR) repeat protein